MSPFAMDASEIYWADELMREGWCVIPDAIELEAVAALNADLDPVFAATPFCEGGFYGERTKRFGSLLKRSAHSHAFVMHSLVLAIANRVLGPWCERISLNLTQGIEIHTGAVAQFPHRDQDMWGGPKGHVEYLINVMWPLSPFTADNGATALWPRSHRAPPDAAGEGVPATATMAPGSVLLFLGSTLHGGGANISAAPRRGMIVSYCLGWLRSFEAQLLLYPPEIARTFDSELAGLVGYAQHRPNLGNVEGRCPSELLSGPMPPHVAARDALRPDQSAALADYVAAQMRELR